MRSVIHTVSLALLLTTGVAVPLTAVRVVRAAPARACTTTGYTRNCTGCIKITSSHAFTLKVPSSRITLRGSGGTHLGTTVCVARVPAPVASHGGQGVRVTATGSFSPLHVRRATIYRFNASKDTVKKVKKIGHPGIYQIVTR